MRPEKLMEFFARAQHWLAEYEATDIGKPAVFSRAITDLGPLFFELLKSQRTAESERELVYKLAPMVGMVLGQVGEQAAEDALVSRVRSVRRAIERVEETSEGSAEREVGGAILSTALGTALGTVLSTALGTDPLARLPILREILERPRGDKELAYGLIGVVAGECIFSSVSMEAAVEIFRTVYPQIKAEHEREGKH